MRGLESRTRIIAALVLGDEGGADPAEGLSQNSQTRGSDIERGGRATPAATGPAIQRPSPGTAFRAERGPALTPPSSRASLLPRCQEAAGVPEAALSSRSSYNDLLENRIIANCSSKSYNVILYEHWIRSI